jgi:polyisoprenyl-phosphate glycosyltransferase
VLLPALRRVLDRLDGDYEIVFVDDGSRDASRSILVREAAADRRIKVLGFSRNFGHQAAITAGLTLARGSVVAVLDADLQDPPELLPQFFAALDQGYDVVYGVRARRKEGAAKRLAYFVFYRLLRRIADTEVPLDSGDFCAMSRRVVDHLNALPESGRFLRGLRAWLGFRQLGIPYERDRRHAGAPKYTLGKLVALSIDGLLSFSIAPLRVIAGVGLMVSSLAFLGILVVLYRYLFTPYVAGYTSLAMLILFIGGIQLLTLGLIGEYIGRISTQVRGRPQFVVDELTGFDDV